MDWQPIETAPKDYETYILAWNAADLMPVVVHWVHWNGRWEKHNDPENEWLALTCWTPILAPPATLEKAA